MAYVIFFLSGLLALAAIYAAAIGWLWFWQERLLFEPESLAADQPVSTDTDVHETFIDVPGARLSAAQLQLPDPRGVVFFLHGNSGNLKKWFVDLEAFRAAVNAAPKVRAFCVQEHESSTGVRHPAKEMAAILREAQPDALVLVDAITGVGVHDVKLSDGFDALVCGSQKALALQPGLAFLGLSKRYLAQVEAPHLPRLYFDLRNELKAHAGDGTAWTPAIGLIAALDAACRWLDSQGGVASLIANAALQASAFRAAVDAWGLSNFAKAPGHALTAVRVEGSSRILKALRDKAGLSLANGQGEMEDHMIRVAHLGYIDGLDTLMAIQALEMAFAVHGVTIARPGGEAAQAVLAGTLR